jgi:hypothetical protein
MTLMELLTTMETQGTIPASRVKDVQTSMRYLARALGKDSPEQCQEADFVLPTAAWKEKLDTYFLAQQQQGKTISPHTLRNTRNNLSFLFRTAHEHALLSTPQPLPQPLYTRRAAYERSTQTSPYAEHWHAIHKLSYRLPFEQWPPDIQTAWRTYCESRQLEVRPITLHNNQKHLSPYIGFLVNIEGRSPQWDDLFDVPALDRFVRWHSQQLHVRLSPQAQMTVQTLKTLASQLDHPGFTAIKTYNHRLPTPDPLHDKQRNLLTLHDLERVGLALLQDAHKPMTTLCMKTKILGLRGALRHQHALMLRLLVRVPLRSRNIREMRLEKNLYQDDVGHWHLHFSGGELKIGTRNGRTNTYHVDLTDYCPDLLPHLEEFLNIYRRRIPNAATSPFVFLTQRGNPYDMHKLYEALSTNVFQRTDKRFYPHLIRTIWASEYLATKGATVEVAAAMLGDTPQMVYQRYYETQEKKAHARASEFLTAALR